MDLIVQQTAILKERLCQKVDFEIYFAPFLGFSTKSVADYCGFHNSAVTLCLNISTIWGPPVL